MRATGVPRLLFNDETGCTADTLHNPIRVVNVIESLTTVAKVLAVNDLLADQNAVAYIYSSWQGGDNEVTKVYLFTSRSFCCAFISPLVL